MLHSDRRTQITAILLSATTFLGACVTPNRSTDILSSGHSLPLPEAGFPYRDVGSSSLGCSREMVGSPIVRMVRELAYGEDVFLKEASNALLKLSPDEVRELFPLLNAAQESVRESVIRLLGHYNSRDVGEELEKRFWREHQSGLRRTILESVAKHGTEASKSFLLKIAHQPELGEISIEGLLLLGEQGAPEVHTRLLEEVDKGTLSKHRLFSALLPYRDEITRSALNSLLKYSDLSDFRVMLFDLRSEKRSDFLASLQSAPRIALDGFTQDCLLFTQAVLGDREVLRLARLGCILEGGDKGGFGPEIALDILGEIGDSSDIPIIVAYFGREYGYKAAFLLAERFGKEAIPALESCLSHDNEMVRVHAIHALGALGDSTASGYLLRWLTLTESDSDFRHHVTALRGSIDKAGVQALATQLLDGKSFSPDQQSILFKELRDALIPALAENVSKVERYSEEEKRLRDLLKMSYGEGALRVFEAATLDPTNEQTYLAMLSTLGGAAAPVYSRMLYSGKESLRHEAARRLCDFSDSYSNPDLELLLTDPDPTLKAYAAIAGARRGVLDGIEILHGILEYSGSRYSEDAGLACLAASRLTEVAGPIGEFLREQCFTKNNLRPDLFDAYIDNPTRAHLEELSTFVRKHRPVFDEVQRIKFVRAVLEPKSNVFDWHTIVADMLITAFRDNEPQKYMDLFKVAVSEPTGREAAIAALGREPPELQSKWHQELHATFSSARIEQNLEYPFRFSKETLRINALNLHAPKRDPSKPLAVLVFPRTDNNGAFNNYDDMITSLREAGYWVEIYEADSGKGYLETTIRAAAMGSPREQLVSLVCWLGHGADDGRSIAVGDRRFGSKDERLDFSDLSRAKFPQFENILSVGCQGLLLSCSGGFGRGTQENMANGLRAMAPSKFAPEGIWSTVAPSYGIELIGFEKDPVLLLPRIRRVKYKYIKESDIYQAHLWSERNMQQKSTAT